MVSLSFFIGVSKADFNRIGLFYHILSSYRERLWCIRKSLCTVRKSQHNCFLHFQRKPYKTKRTKRRNKLNHHRRSSSSPLKSSISSSTLSFIIITVIITVPECQNHFVVEMVSVSCTSKPLDVLNSFQQVKKTKDLESLPSFSSGLTQLEEEERNGFCELYSKTTKIFIGGVFFLNSKFIFQQFSTEIKPKSRGTRFSTTNNTEPDRSSKKKKKSRPERDNSDRSS